MAVGQVLRGMQRAGGEGWTAVVLRLRGWGGGRCAALCRLLLPFCTPLRSRRKNTTVKGFNMVGVEMKMKPNPKNVLKTV